VQLCSNQIELPPASLKFSGLMHLPQGPSYRHLRVLVSLVDWNGSPESALKWIGSLKENYILIFDNADVLSPAALEAYFPPGMRGNILITSRNSAMMTLTSPESSLEVTEMEERDAIGLLLKASCLKSPTSNVQIQASKIVKSSSAFLLLLTKLVHILLLGPLLFKSTLQNIQSTEKHYYPILNLLELLSITELSMKLGSYHTKKFNKGLNLMILIRPMQPIVQCYF
jgi:hypothetical protein